MLIYLEHLFRRTFDIREGEGSRVVLMFIYIFCIISALLIVKPVANSLFLSHLGASQLPVAFLLVAVLAAAVAAFYAKLLKKIPLNRLIVKTLQICMASLLVFWVFLYLNYLESWILYIFYAWVAIFALISASQFWILANLIFNAREAKRLFGFLGSGAIAGGIFGGYLTNFLAPIIGSEHLLGICIGFLGICIPITRTVWKKSAAHESTIQFQRQKQLQKNEDRPWRLLKNSRHLAFLAGIVGISVVAAKLVEYQFSAVASAQITEEDQLTAFFGFWLSNLNIASLLIQLFVTRRVVGVFGVGTSLFFLPVGIFIGAAALLINPALWTAVLLKISDGSLKNSINKAGMELMVLPIPPEIKNQAKTFIDVFVDSFATGIGGIVLIILTFALGFSVREISVITIALTGLWTYLIFHIRREYIQSFRLKLEPEWVHPSPEKVDIQNESVFGGLIKVLEGDDERQILSVLKMVKDARHPRLIPCFKKLIHHPSGAVRLAVLENVYFYRDGDFITEAEQLINDPNQEIKTEALEYLFSHAPGDRIEMLHRYLDNPEYLTRGAALLCAARESRKNQELKKIFKIRQAVEEAVKQIPQMNDEAQADFTKINCTRVIGAANIPELYPYLHIFLNAVSPKALKAAIISAAQTAHPEFIPVLLNHLGNKAVAGYARQALASFGTPIINDLASCLENPVIDRNIRLKIPKTLALIKVQNSVDILIRNLDQSDVAIRYEVIRALNRLRVNSPHLKFGDQNIDKRVLEEAHNYMDTLAVLYAQINTAHQKTNGDTETQIKEARAFLIHALEERLDHNLERIFRLLGLKYPPDDIYKAYLGIQKNSLPDMRANALEFLDNLLDPNLKKIIVPLVETTVVETLIDDMLKEFGFAIPAEFDCFVMLLSGDDNWLKVCVLSLVGLLKDGRYIPYIGALIDNPDPKVKQMAKYALTEIGILRTGAHNHTRK